LHGRSVQFSVCLRSRSADRGAFAAVEEPELDSRLIGYPTHKSIQRVDLAYQVALAQTANCRIAGHLANRVEPVSQEQSSGSKAGRGSSGFAAGVSSANH
jgi:hypothetical protein